LGLFVAISDQARRFADLLKRRDYKSAGAALTDGYRIRSTLLPALHPDDLELIEMAATSQCGVSMTGRGGGGCIWAIGEKEGIADLKAKWAGAFERRKAGALLPFTATPKGLSVSINGAADETLR
jgi:D-glycero-alpha-D-manno-heptose-7-phosphate kinase